MTDNKNSADAFIRASTGLSISSFPPNSYARVQALEAARSLVRRLQTPIEAILDCTFVAPTLVSAIEVAWSNNVFQRLKSDNGQAKTTEELTVTDTTVMRRILRNLAAGHFVEEVDKDLWKGTKISDSLTQDEMYGVIRSGSLFTMPIQTTLVEVLTENGYKEVATTDGAWQKRYGKDARFYDTVYANPEMKWAFSNMMKGYVSQLEIWTQVYDTSQLVKANGDEMILVDVGGNAGHDAMKFLEQYPEMKGRVAVQDRPDIINENADSMKRGGIIPMVHDFFTEQPIRNARAYFLHSILHNWPDKESREILQQLKPAMKRGYSRILINELALPERGANIYSTSVDMMMWAIFNARERNEREWKEFLESEGYNLVKIWRGDGTPEAVIEAVLKD